MHIEYYRKRSAKFIFDISKKMENFTSTSGSNLADNIRIHHSELTYMINTNFGLLDELLSSNVLSQERIEMIDSLPKCSQIKRVNQLLNEVLEMPCIKQEQFIDALNRNRQSHVVNYIKDVKTTCRWRLAFV